MFNVKWTKKKKKHQRSAWSVESKSQVDGVAGVGRGGYESSLSLICRLFSDSLFLFLFTPWHVARSLSSGLVGRYSKPHARRRRDARIQRHGCLPYSIVQYSCDQFHSKLNWHLQLDWLNPLYFYWVISSSYLPDNKKLTLRKTKRLFLNQK